MPPRTSRRRPGLVATIAVLFGLWTAAAAHADSPFFDSWDEVRTLARVKGQVARAGAGGESFRFRLADLRPAARRELPGQRVLRTTLITRAFDDSLDLASADRRGTLRR